MQSSNLTNRFLIAMPALADPNFHHTVTYICAHNEEGAMGIVINRPLDLEFGEIIQQMNLKPNNQDVQHLPIYHGGPVQIDRGFVLHDPDEEWSSSIQISPDLGMTTSRDILEAIAAGEGPEHSLIALGYAGWASGQLEQELMDNAWLSAPVDADIIFNTPCDKRWTSATALLGFASHQISPEVGHA
ncbi:MAG: YqgE/AlgH family protein [Gammaproteobacteria bacterium]